MSNIYKRGNTNEMNLFSSNEQNNKNEYLQNSHQGQRYVPCDLQKTRVLSI